MLSARLGFGVRQAPLIPLLGPLLGLDLEENDLIAAMTDEVRAANLRALLLAALGHLGETSRVVLTVEDAHWLDSSSWTLLLAAARALPGLLIAVTSRPLDDPPPEYIALAD
jgi:hypothetical protein